MELKYQKWNKIMQMFFENPQKTFTLRIISKQTKIPLSSVQRYVEQLKKSNLITLSNKAENTPYFKVRKTQFFINKMFTSGLIDYLEKQLQPSVIILFGSIRKGESDQTSDIDLFIETQKIKTVDLSKFEKKLKHKIELHLKENINELPKRLFNNIINGIKLRGYINIK